MFCAGSTPFPRSYITVCAAALRKSLSAQDRSFRVPLVPDGGLPSTSVFWATTIGDLLANGSLQAIFWPVYCLLLTAAFVFAATTLAPVPTMPPPAH